MSFRRTIFIALSLTALVMVVLEGALDLVLDRVADGQDRRNAARLEVAVDEAIAAIFAGPPAADQTVTLPGGGVRYTVRLGEVNVPPALTTDDADSPWRTTDRWLRTVRPLGFARSVEVEMELHLGEYVLANRLLLDLLDFPLFLVIALVTALILTRHIARPVRSLTAATHGLAAKRFGEPVAVPPGGDELSELATSFNAMAREVQGFLDRERAFSRYVSHELRTPLAALRLQTDRATLGLASAETVLPVIDKQVARIEGILEGLLHLARMSEPDTEPRRLRPIVDEALAAYPSAARERLSLVDDTPPGATITNSNLLVRALGNLIDNALRHGKGSTVVSLRILNSQLSLTVSDEGPGVPAAAIDRLTQPFFRLGNDDDSLGLGLSLVALIARSLGGSFEMRNLTPGIEARLVLPILGATSVS